jgi:hypothetical protein
LDPIDRIDALRADFIETKMQLSDAKALINHYKSRTEEQQESLLKLITEPSRANRDGALAIALEGSIRGLSLNSPNSERRPYALAEHQGKAPSETHVRKLQKDLENVTLSRNEIAKQLDIAMTESNRLRTMLEQKDALLQSRSAESPPLQSFSSNQDRATEQEIRNLVRELNIKILDATKNISQNVRLYPGARFVSIQDEYIGTLVGRKMLYYLTNRDHDKDLTLVNMTITHLLSAVMVAFVKSWPFPFKSEAKKTVWTIYKRSRAHGEENINDIMSTLPVDLCQIDAP